jgi:hypothetical protein
LSETPYCKVVELTPTLVRKILMSGGKQVVEIQLSRFRKYLLSKNPYLCAQ